MFDKHIHASKPFDSQFVIPHFSPACMCLAFNSKKNSLVISTLQFRGIYIVVLFFLFCSSSLALLHLRSSFASKPFQVRFIEWAKNGSCIEFGRDLQGRCKDVNIFNAKTRRHKELFLEHGKHRINEINARLMWY